MRKGPMALAILMLAGVLSGCISSDDTNVPTDDSDLMREVRTGWMIPETITGMEEMGNMEFILEDGTPLELSVTGIWFHDDLLYTSGTGLAIVDISDPEWPVTLSFMEGTGSRDVDIMTHPNGNLYAVLAGTPGIRLIDVTDPRAPFEAGNVSIGFHNLATVPGTSLVYNSRSLYAGADLATEGGLVDIVDFADPANPTVTAWRMGHVAMTVDGAAKPVTAPACHDVAVYTDVNRAYCAGVTETQVWDIEDPANPVILQIVANPGTNIHHAAYANKDHTVLILGDELGGAAFAPGCTVPNQAYGGVWFVDISDLKTPTPLGWWAPETPMPGDTPCTAHFGNIIEDRDLLVMGYYHAGVFVIDFSNPMMPVEIANYRAGGTVWEGQYYRGNIFTGDTGRGVDILKLVGEGEEAFPKE